MTLGFTFEVDAQTSTIPTKIVEVSVNHLVVDRSDTATSLVATIDLVTSGGPIYDDVGALIVGFPLTESAPAVNKVVTFPLRATTDSTGAARHLRSLQGKEINYSLTLTGNIGGKKVTLLDNLLFNVDAEDPSPITLAEIVGPLAPFLPELSPAAREALEAYMENYVDELVYATRAGPPGPPGPRGPQV